VVAVAVAIFAMQNTAMVTVRFIVWQVPEVPLAAVVLASLAAGVVIVGVPLWFQLWRTRTRVRSLGASPRPESPPPDRPFPPPDRPLDE
jgi:uncharacterized integral membrane protein